MNFKRQINADLRVKSNAFIEANIPSSLIETSVIIKSGIRTESPYNIKKSLPIQKQSINMPFTTVVVPRFVGR
jgi:hypothetical protein